MFVSLLDWSCVSPGPHMSETAALSCGGPKSLVYAALSSYCEQI